MVFIRAFLINKNLNARGWRINATTLAKNVLSFVRRPLILKRFANGQIDHREWNSSQSASQNLQEQERYSIGQIRKVLYDSQADDYFADVEITNPEAEKWIRDQRKAHIPIAVSPQIIYDRRTELDGQNITNWFGSHLAIVSAGAYGPSAVATNLCNGECPIELQKGLDASAFDFSISAALDAALTSLGESDSSENHYKMAMVEVRPPDGQQAQPNQQQQPQQLIPSQPREPAFIRDSPNNRSPLPVVPPISENQGFNKEQGQEQQQPPKIEQEVKIDYKQLSEQYKTELEGVKAIQAEHEKKLAKNDADNKERAIRDAIPIFLDEFIDKKKGTVNQEAVDNKVKEFLKRGFSPADIKYMYDEKVAAWEQLTANEGKQAAPCSCGGGGGGNTATTTTAANASIFTVPTTQVETEATPSQQQQPWFVQAAKLMNYAPTNFSKRPGRVL